MGFFSSGKICVVKAVKTRLQSAQFLDLGTAYLAIMDVESASLKGKTLSIAMTSNVPCLHRQQEIENQLTAVLADSIEFLSLTLTLSFDAKTLNTSDTVAGVKQIVLVASGKGGVGKSTTAVNLALALAHGGAKVGILDADIYGPSIPAILGLDSRKATTADGALLEPMQKYGVVTMSIGFLVPKEDATVWRGPMASRALSQLLNETNWGSLDYLVVDMPPGTGDIQLTMSGQVPVSGAVVVTTPQNLALDDAQKGISMFNKVNVAVLGVIENMSYHLCSACGHHDPVFGSDGGDQLASENQVPLLGKLPLVGQIAQDTQAGTPTLLTPTTEYSLAYLNIAQRLSIRLNKTNQTIATMATGE